jgi:hypothetical protein
MKYGISLVAVAALMLATPALADTNFDGGPTGTGTDWNTAENWDTDLVPSNPAPSGGDTVINGAYNVVIDSAAPRSDGLLIVQGGASLTINANIESGDDLEVNGGGTVNMQAGFLDLGNRKVKFGVGTFNMKGGTVEVGDKFEMYNGSLLNITGGTLEAKDTDGFEFDGGIIRVDGDAATIYCDQVTSGGGTFEFVPTAAGGISTITSATDALKKIRGAGISVALDALTVDEVDMMLFSGILVDPMSVTVTKDAGATVLVLGTDYTLDYVNGTDLGLKLSVVPEPATMSLLAIGGLALLRRRKRRA